jgi:hypothetical protein
MRQTFRLMTLMTMICPYLGKFAYPAHIAHNPFGEPHKENRMDEYEQIAREMDSCHFSLLHRMQDAATDKDKSFEALGYQWLRQAGRWPCRCGTYWFWRTQQPAMERGKEKGNYGHELPRIALEILRDRIPMGWKPYKKSTGQFPSAFLALKYAAVVLGELIDHGIISLDTEHYKNN